jgi:hypothetical protein
MVAGKPAVSTAGFPSRAEFSPSQLRICVVSAVARFAPYTRSSSQNVSSMGEVTVLRALEAGDPAKYAEVVRRRAGSVWGAWGARHETVRLWAARSA